MAKVIEAKSGREVGSVPIGPGPDCVMFDASRHLAFVATGGDGMLTIMAIKGGKEKGVGQVPYNYAGSGAARSARSEDRAALSADRRGQVDTAPGQRRTLIPGTFAVLVVAPN